MHQATLHLDATAAATVFAPAQLTRKGAPHMTTQAIISADSHFVEPPEMWRERIDAELPRPGAAARHRDQRKARHVLRVRRPAPGNRWRLLRGGHRARRSSRGTRARLRDGARARARSTGAHRRAKERWRHRRSPLLVLRHAAVLTRRTAICATRAFARSTIGPPTTAARAETASSASGSSRSTTFRARSTELKRIAGERTQGRDDLGRAARRPSVQPSHLRAVLGRRARTRHEDVAAQPHVQAPELRPRARRHVVPQHPALPRGRADDDRPHHPRRAREVPDVEVHLGRERDRVDPVPPLAHGPAPREAAHDVAGRTCR